MKMIRHQAPGRNPKEIFHSKFVCLSDKPCVIFRTKKQGHVIIAPVEHVNKGVFQEVKEPIRHFSDYLRYLKPVFPKGTPPAHQSQTGFVIKRQLQNPLDPTGKYSCPAFITFDVGLKVGFHQ